MKEFEEYALIPWPKMDHGCNPETARVTATDSLIRDNVFHVWATRVTTEAYQNMCDIMSSHFTDYEKFNDMCYTNGYFIGGSIVNVIGNVIPRDSPLDVYVDEQGFGPMGQFLQSNGYLPVGQYEAVGRGTRMFYYQQEEGA